MAKIKNENELTQHKNNAINKLSSYIDKLIQSDDTKEKGKADKLSYWIEDFTKFLEFERTRPITSHPIQASRNRLN